MEIALRTASASRTTSWPQTIAVPLVGADRVASIRTIVVLPAPLGPSRDVTVPASTRRSMWSTATRSPKRLVSPSVMTVSSGGVIAVSFSYSKHTATEIFLQLDF